MNRRLLSLLLALLMLVSIVPTAAFAAAEDGDAIPVEPPAAQEDVVELAETPEDPANAVEGAPAALAAAGDDIPQYSNNIALNKKVYVSSDKFAGTSTGATKDKANDGTATGKIGGQGQWVPNDMKGNSAEKPAWIVFDLATAKDGTTAEFTPVHIESINIWYNGKNWAQNYKVQTAASYDDANRDATVWTDLVTVTRTGVNANVTNGSDQNIADTANDCDTITLTSAPALVANAQAQRYVRLYIEEMNSACPYDDMGMVEFQLLANPDELPASASSVLERLSLDLTQDGDNKVTGVAISGNVPQGYTATVAANLEQVVGPDGTIYTPLMDTQVELAIEVTKNDGSERAVTPNADVQTVTILGAHTAQEAEGGNPKPAVIPEIMEWFSTMDEAAQAPFRLTPDSRIVHRNNAAGDFDAVANALTADAKDLFGDSYALTHSHISGNYNQVIAAAQSGDIVIYDVQPTGTMANSAKVAGFDHETYRIEITDKVIIYATDATGAYWATRTLLQALKLSQADTGELAVVRGTMRDYPEFKVRGFVMDVGRKPISMDMLRQITQNMAWYKLNDFHIHLNDNLIFMEDYCTQSDKSDYQSAYESYSAFRLESRLEEEEGAKPLTAKDYAYTKTEFKQFIADCAALGVTVVPEIDVPAHAKAITDAFPSLRLNKTGTYSDTTRPWIDHLDLTNKMDESVAKVNELFDEYIDGNVFGDIVHFGADEYYDGTANYAPFAKAMVDHLRGEKGKTVRLWGSLSSMGDVNNLFAPEYTRGVQMNIWNTGWANPQAMYNKGFDLINVTDGPFYMVPNGTWINSGGTSGRGGYGDYLNLTAVYDKAPNQIGGTTFPAGASQILGEAFAIWNDNIDTRASGLDETDMFDRFFDTLPVVAVRQWGEGAALDRTLAEVQADAAILGTAPNTNPYHEVKDKVQGASEHLRFDFSDNQDTSGNGRDLTLHGAVIQSGALSIANGYADLGLDQAGWGSKLSFRIWKNANSNTAEQVIFESDAPYGEFAIKALPGSDADHWKLGFARELYDYEFDAELPTGEWIDITLINEQQSTVLYAGEHAGVTAVGKFVSKPDSNTQFRGKTGITNASFAFPLGRIGSKNGLSFQGNLDDLSLTDWNPVEVDMDQYIVDPSENTYTVTAPSIETTDHENQDGSHEGPIRFVIDNDPTTFWHTGYGDNLSNTPENRYIQIELANPETLGSLQYLPRPTVANGIVTKYRVEVSTDGSTYTPVAQGDWAHSTTLKTATFEQPQENIRFIRLYGEETRGGSGDAPNKFMTAAEIRVCTPFDLAEGSITLPDTVFSLGENGESATPNPQVIFGGKILAKDVDYTVSYAGNDTEGLATVTVTGKGAYSGQLTAQFHVTAATVVEKRDLSAAQLTMDASYPLENGAASPDPVVTLGGVTLVRGLDYSVSYLDNTTPGATATVIITGIGAYRGTRQKTFTVDAALTIRNLSGAALTLHQTSLPYAGGAEIRPTFSVTYGSDTLTEGVDFTVVYRNNTSVTNAAEVVITGKGRYEGTKTARFSIIDPASRKDLRDDSKTSVTFSPSSYAYTGSAITPAPTVTYDGVVLTKDTDYKVNSYLYNTKPGTGMVVIEGIGDYFGATTGTFIITPTNHSSSGGNSSGGNKGTSSVSTSTTETQSDGVTVKKVTDASGKITTQTSYPDGTQVSGVINVDGPATATVAVPSNVDKATVIIPTKDTPTDSHVAVILHEDGTQEIVKTSLPVQDGLQVTLEDSAVLQVVDNAKTFIDVPSNNWALNAISFVTSREIFNGTGANTFTPNGKMSRAMVCTVLANLAGEDTKSGSTWYEKGLDWAKSNGISDGSVPHATITREQLAAMLYRYAGCPDVMNEVPRRFRDRDSVSDWSEMAVTWCAENDLLRGRAAADGTLELAPQATATRAEVAAILQRYVALIQ